MHGAEPIVGHLEHGTHIVAGGHVTVREPVWTDGDTDAARGVEVHRVDTGDDLTV
jgi:hypothetical protein